MIPSRAITADKQPRPVFKEIAERAANYLNIRPEDGSDPVALHQPPQQQP